MPTRDVVAWNAMIMGYGKCGQGLKALDLYKQMLLGGVEPDPVTFMEVLNACASVGALEEGRLVHEQIVLCGHESDDVVSSSLIIMYAKCGSLEDSWKVFDSIPRKTVVGWNAMITGFVKRGEGQQALLLYKRMYREGVEPNAFTYVGLLNACASVGALEEGEGFDKQIVDKGYDSDIFVACSLIDMYAKCGNVEGAQGVFNKIAKRNLAVWNAMLGGHAMHGQAWEALQLVERMSQERVVMDGITFVSILSACSHGGLVDEGLHIFKSMNDVYKVIPRAEHYACVIDLLGRAGRLHEAEHLLETIVPEQNVTCG
jgi:pentatricopeptide repeat protein